MKNSLAILIPLLFLAACSRPLGSGSNPTELVTQSPLPKRTASFDWEITTSGVKRRFRLHVPENHKENIPMSLVLVFHGYTDTAEQVEEQTGMSAKADQEGFMVVYPEGIDYAWYTGPGADGRQDRQFIRDLISYLQSQYRIDPKRIFATGISNGGGMADRLGCSLADVIAAIGPVAGAYTFWQNCNPSRPVPVMAFHGLDDTVIPYTGGDSRTMAPPIEEWAAAWAERNGCGPTPDVTRPSDTVAVGTWTNCSQRADVVLYTLANHGHSWPGSLTLPKAITSQAVDTTDVMWEFFQAHPMP